MKFEKPKFSTGDTSKRPKSDEVLPNIKAYSILFEGKRPLVATTLNLPGLHVERFYLEY
jgi:hypothetical protein